MLEVKDAPAHEAAKEPAPGAPRGPNWEQEANDHHAEETRLGEKDQEMLHRLVAIRESLWT